MIQTLPDEERIFPARLFTQQAAKLREAQSIHHVFRLKRCAAGLAHAELEESKFFGGMGVGSQHDRHSTVLGGGERDFVQIETARLAIQFHEAAIIGRRLQHFIQIDGICFPLPDQAARGMPDSVDMRAADCVHQAGGYLFLSLILPVVNRGDDPIGLRQEIVGQVELAIF